MSRRSKVAFIFACLFAGLSLGAGIGFGLAGLAKKIPLFVLSIGEILAFLVLALAIVALLFVGVSTYKRRINQKAVAPYFHKVTAVKDIHFSTGEIRRNRHSKVMVLSYFDPREAEKGGLLHSCGVNSAIENYFQGQTLYFAAPNRFVFFLLPEEEKAIAFKLEGLSKKLKNKDHSLRLLAGVSSSLILNDFQAAYAEAVTALEDKFPARENLSIVRYEDTNPNTPLAGLSPIEKEFVSASKESIAIYPFGFNNVPADLGILGQLGLREEYEEASLALAKSKMEGRNGKVGIFFSPASFHASSFYLKLAGFAAKKRLIVLLPAKENEPKLGYAAKKIKRLGCLVGYYGVDNTVPISRLDLEGAYLYLDPSFYDEDNGLVKAKKRLFKAKSALTIGGSKEEDFVAYGGEA